MELHELMKKLDIENWEYEYGFLVAKVDGDWEIKLENSIILTPIRQISIFLKRNQVNFEFDEFGNAEHRVSMNIITEITKKE